MNESSRTETWSRVRRPVMSVMLGASWLLLQQSLDLGNVITACLLGWALPRLLGGLMGPAVRVRAISSAARLLLIVLRDIVVSNITVARLVLNPFSQPRPVWVKVPLRVQEPTAQFLLASIITMTPGTVSAIVDESAACIWVHVLDCDDPSQVVLDIDQRYQGPLMEIFG